MEYAIDNSILIPNLKQIITNGEPEPGKTKESFDKEFNIEIFDTYDTPEFGLIACQCHEYKKYHIQSENIYLEILDENNSPCPTGKIGRIIITSLHNFASPMIRYDTGHYASFCKPCKCGRTLPTLSRISSTKHG